MNRSESIKVTHVHCQKQIQDVNNGGKWEGVKGYMGTICTVHSLVSESKTAKKEKKNRGLLP